MQKAVFLDRDGTLIYDEVYLADPSKIRFIPGAIAALRALAARGYALVVISNQSGVARGLIRPEQLAAVHARIDELLAAEGVHLAGAYHCVHGPDDGCDCRKPMPGMILQAARDLGLDLPSSVMIGDKPSDVQAGEAAGARGLLFTGDWTRTVESLDKGAPC